MIGREGKTQGYRMSSITNTNITDDFHPNRLYSTTDIAEALKIRPTRLLYVFLEQFEFIKKIDEGWEIGPWIMDNGWVYTSPTRSRLFWTAKGVEWVIRFVTIAAKDAMIVAEACESAGCLGRLFRVAPVLALFHDSNPNLIWERANACAQDWAWLVAPGEEAA